MKAKFRTEHKGIAFVELHLFSINKQLTSFVCSINHHIDPIKLTWAVRFISVSSQLLCEGCIEHPIFMSTNKTTFLIADELAVVTAIQLASRQFRCNYQSLIEIGRKRVGCSA